MPRHQAKVRGGYWLQRTYCNIQLCSFSEFSHCWETTLPPPQGPQAPIGMFCCRVLVFFMEKLLKWGNFREEMLSLFNCLRSLLPFCWCLEKTLNTFLKTVTSKSQIYLGTLNDSYITKLKNKKTKKTLGSKLVSDRTAPFLIKAKEWMNEWMHFIYPLGGRFKYSCRNNHPSCWTLKDMLQCSTDLLLQTSSEKEEEIADLTPRRRRRRRMNGGKWQFYILLSCCVH